MIVEKNSAQCHHNSGVITAKRCFREVLLDLVGINFRNCGTSIDPGHRWVDAGYIFDVNNVPFERSPEAAVSRRQLRSCRRSVSCDLVNVNKHKLLNFDRPLGLPGHRRRRV